MTRRPGRAMWRDPVPHPDPVRPGARKAAQDSQLSQVRHHVLTFWLFRCPPRWPQHVRLTVIIRRWIAEKFSAVSAQLMIVPVDVRSAPRPHPPNVDMFLVCAIP